MGFIKDLILGPPPPPRLVGPVKVYRFWRELNETVLLGMSRSHEETSLLIHADQDAFGVHEARQLFVYRVEPVTSCTVKNLDI